VPWTPAPSGGADLFEEYIIGVRAATGAQVDWHYSCGLAQVLVLGDTAPVREAILATPLPRKQMIPKWFGPGEGMFRNFGQFG